MERVNYPSNCFTLNIKKDTEEEANGIIRITFFLKRPKSADSKETNKMQNLFWLPLIQIHRYRYNSWVHYVDTDTTPFNRNG